MGKIATEKVLLILQQVNWMKSAEIHFMGLLPQCDLLCIQTIVLLINNNLQLVYLYHQIFDGLIKMPLNFRIDYNLIYR